jgi:hypothetical protein
MGTPIRPIGGPNDRLLRAAGLMSQTAGRAGENQEAVRQTPKSFGDEGGRKKTLRTIVIDLSTARTEAAPLELNIVGNCLACMDGTFTTSRAYVRVNAEGNFIPIGPGALFMGFPFDSVQVWNAAQAGGTLTLAYYTDYPGDRSLLLYR